MLDRYLLSETLRIGGTCEWDVIGHIDKNRRPNLLIIGGDKPGNAEYCVGLAL